MSVPDVLEIPPAARVYARDHWSPNQFMTWDLCPQTYYERYFGGERHLPSEPMLFGSAIHLALAEHYAGGDGDKAFKHAANALGVQPRWVGSGLYLLELAYDLSLEGRPEQAFSIATELVWDLPTIGSIDLIDVRRRTVYDFKCSIGAWGQERADRDPWQPTLYRWAAHDRYGLAPVQDGPEVTGEPWRFVYVVLNRRTLEVSLLEPSMPWVQAWDQCYEAGRMIASMVRAGAFPCTGQHGKCPECGETWQHEHVCDWSVAPPRIHLGRSA